MPYSFQIPSCDQCRVCRLSAFNDLSKSQLQTLNEKKEGRMLKKGQILFYEGNIPEGVFAIYEGTVKLYLQSQGKEQIVQIMGPGSLLGCRAILGKDNYQMTAATLEESKVCFIPKKDFEHLLQTDLAFAQTMLFNLSKDLGCAQKKIADLKFRNAEQRILHALKDLELVYNHDPNGYINAKISRSNLAQLAGLSLESSVRGLKSLEKSGALELSGKNIKLVF